MDKTLNKRIEKINVRKLLSSWPYLDRGLNLKNMFITRARAIDDCVLYDIFGALYENFEACVVPRLGTNGIILSARFSYFDKKGSGTSTHAPLGMIINPLVLGASRVRYLNLPHYIRFNTELCMNVPPERNYTGLNDVIEPFVSSADPEYVGKNTKISKETEVMTDELSKKYASV